MLSRFTLMKSPVSIWKPFRAASSTVPIVLPAATATGGCGLLQRFRPQLHRLALPERAVVVDRPLARPQLEDQVDGGVHHLAGLGEVEPAPLHLRRVEAEPDAEAIAAVGQVVAGIGLGRDLKRVVIGERAHGGAELMFSVIAAALQMISSAGESCSLIQASSNPTWSAVSISCRSFSQISCWGFPGGGCWRRCRISVGVLLMAETRDVYWYASPLPP